MGDEKVEEISSMIINRNNCSQDELAIYIENSEGAIQVLNGSKFKQISKDDLYYINPNRNTIKLKVNKNKFQLSSSSLSSESSGICGYGLNLI